MPRPAKATDHLDKVRHLMGTMPDKEVAALAGDSAAAVGLYRRKYAIPAYEGYKFSKGRGGSARKGRVAKKSSAAESSPGRRGRASKLEAYHEEIGKVPDAVIAEKAGVTRQAVRQYRATHKIPLDKLADGRRADSPKAPRTKHQVSGGNQVSVATTEDAGATRKPRVSKLDPFRDQLGQVPDSEIAALAEVSVAAVRQYRQKHGIAAAGRGGRPRKHGTEAAASSRSTSSSRGGQRGYGVTIQTKGTTQEHIVLAANIVAATHQAAEAISAGQLQGEIVVVRHLGPALP